MREILEVSKNLMAMSNNDQKNKKMLQSASFMLVATDELLTLDEISRIFLRMFTAKNIPEDRYVKYIDTINAAKAAMLDAISAEKKEGADA